MENKTVVRIQTRNLKYLRNKRKKALSENEKAVISKSFEKLVNSCLTGNF